MRFFRLPFRVTLIFVALASFFALSASARSMTDPPGVMKEQVEAISISNALQVEHAGRAATITSKQFEP